MIRAQRRTSGVGTQLSSGNSHGSEKEEQVTRLPKVIIAVFGANKVGKTSLIERFVDGKSFKKGEQFETVEDTYERSIAADDCTVQDIQILDTAGTISSEDIRHFYIKRAHGFVLVYGADQPDSFRAVSAWRQEIESLKGPAPVIVVANKLDAANKANLEQAQTWASVQKVGYVELSANTSPEELVAMPFVTISRQVLESTELSESVSQSSGFNPGKMFSFLQSKERSKNSYGDKR